SAATTGPNQGLVAALLTRMSSPPNSARQWATPASTASGSPTEPAKAVASPPAARSVVTVSSSSACLRAVTQTAAPAATSASATARPMPRVGYHRGLDALRQAGWRGSGYVRASHPENIGFLRALDGLRRQAGRIGEADEEARCAEFLHQLDPAWPASGA